MVDCALQIEAVFNLCIYINLIMEMQHSIRQTFFALQDDNLKKITFLLQARRSTELS